MKHRLRLRDRFYPWSVKDILRLIGAALVAVPAVVLVFPFVGAGTGQSHEPGSDLARTLSLSLGQLVDGTAGAVALGIAGLGVLVLIVSCFAPE